VLHKLILMSVIVAALVLPWRAARLHDPKRGVSSLAVAMLLFIAVWVISIKLVVMRIIVIPSLEQ